MKCAGPAWWSLCLLSAWACSTGATIRTQNGLSIEAIEARIIDSDADGLEVQTDVGGPARVPRARIVDVDHPGNVLLVAGLSIVALVAIVTAPEQDSFGDALLTDVILGAPGLVMIAWGGTTYLRSRRASADLRRETPRLRTLPPDRPYLPAPTWSSFPGAAPGSNPPVVPPASPSSWERDHWRTTRGSAPVSNE